MRRRTVLACAAVAGLALSACAGPQNHYVSQKPGSAPAGSVYFTVPEAWTSFPTTAISAAEKGWSDDAAMKSVLDATTWQEAFDASAQPDLAHVLGSAPVTEPTVYASLRTVYGGETVTTASLRDMVLPLSTLGSAVTVRSEDALAQGGAQGVHLVLSYRASAGAPEETIDQTSYLSDGKDAVYLLVVRCTTSCYDANADQIRSVTSSYTIQGDSSG
ncbi:MAG TPA: hypothetical protein VFL59_06530 [Candidatus Nanopelagicales bacterium]|nr:hypothetical protein [Candidatus Nanopelagicales bacterium]